MFLIKNYSLKKRYGLLIFIVSAYILLLNGTLYLLNSPPGFVDFIKNINIGDGNIFPRQSAHPVVANQVDTVRRLKRMERYLNELMLPYKQKISRATLHLRVRENWNSLSNKDKATRTPSRNVRNINESYYRSFVAYHNITRAPGLKTRRKCEHKYKLVILVQSHISHFSRRNIIRSTWGGGNITNASKYYRWWRVLFLIGKTNSASDIPPLANEISLYEDILLVDTHESFYNLTEKLQKGFQWISKYCSFQYLLKADDDIYVNVPGLYNYLEDPSTPTFELYTGQVMWWSEVYRSGRYGVEKEYKRHIYPRYCSGGGYVLSRDVVLRFIDLFRDVPYMRIDDAYFGELALKAGIHVTQNDNFLMWVNGCDYKNTSIVMHPVDNKECMMKMFQMTFPEMD